MDCFGCRQQFNDKERCPRLLIQCGHTLCETCLSQKLQNRIVTCLECGTMNFAESINLMPKNIALLNVKRQNNVTVTVLKNSPASRRIQNEEESNKDENNCTKHSKKYEAFCMSDKVLLCINCILEENHKNHELESIQNARNGEMKTVEKHLAKAEHLKQKIVNSINSISESTSQLSKITDKSLHEITHFYNNIRKIVNEREEKQKNRVKEQMEREEANLNIQQKSFQSVLQKIEEQSTLYKDLSNLSPILFLKQSNKRKQSMQEATIEESALNVSHSISTKFSFNKEREVQSLIKIINSYLKHEQNKASQAQKNENGGQQNANQKALKLNTNILTQTSSQQAASAAMAGVASSHSNNGNSAVQNATKQSKQSSLANNKRDQKTSKVNTQNKEGNTQFQNQPNRKLNSQQTAEISSQSSKTKKSFNVLEELKSEELLDDKAQNIQSHSKQSILNKPLNNFQEMRNQFKEKITSEREQTKSSSSRDEQNYQSHGINAKKDQQKQQNEKTKRSPVSMISLLNTPNPNPAPTVTSSLNYHPTKGAAGVQVSLQSNSSRPNNNQASNTTASSSLSNSKNLSSTSSVNKIQNKISPKQDVSKKQDQKQILVNLDFAQQMQSNNQHDQIGKRINTHQNQNENDSIEMSEIALNISEKNEDHQEHVVNNSFKGEINTFLQESSQLKSNITPNLTLIPHQQQSSMDTPVSGFNTSQSYGISKFNNYVNDQNDIYQNKFDFSSLQNSNQFIYVFGGFTENQQYTIDRYDLARNTWEQFDIMPTNRSKFCSALLMNGNILMIGGKQDSQRTASIDEYNPRFKTFLKSSLQLTSPRSGFGVVYKNDMIYVVGGNDGYGILDTMEVYDFVLKQIRPYPKMLEKRDELAVTQGLDGKIYAIGGFGGEYNTCLNSAERYNPIYQRWEKIAPLNIPRRALSAVTLPDGIYAIGGFDGNNYINSVEKYDEQLDRWTYVSSMRYSRCTSSAVVSQNNQHIYVFGGFDNGPLDSVERFNVINGMWESLHNMPNKRFMHSCQLIQK
ncbi:hypothetical protein ABPG74_006234 [Tetrahymena malaccensis]